MADEVPQEGGSPQLAQKLVVQINQMLSQLGQMLDQAGVLDEAGAQKYAGILQGFQEFVESDLGSAPGEPSAAKPQVPMAPPETQGKPSRPAMA